jgi:uncharacterized circularly permuted ATP-grasp superfamily protein
MNQLLKNHFSDSFLDKFNLAGTAGKTILGNRVLVSHVLKPLWESMAGEEVDSFEAAIRQALRKAKDRRRKIK